MTKRAKFEDLYRNAFLTSSVLRKKDFAFLQKSGKTVVPRNGKKIKEGGQNVVRTPLILEKRDQSHLTVHTVFVKCIIFSTLSISQRY